MKRKLIGLLLACVLLSGCRIGSDPIVQTEPPSSEIPTTQTDATALPLLEQGVPLEDSANLLVIPNDTLENMSCPEIRLLGNGLLLSGSIDQTLVLNHISLEDGRLIASGSLSAGPETKLTIGSREIGLCDRESGLITILDEGFQVLRSYPITAEGDDWYLNQELDTLYIFYSDRGLVARNLETGKEIWLIDDGFRVTSLGDGTSYLFVQYIDRKDQKTYTRCLNMSTATLETLPIDSPVTGGARQVDTWLFETEKDHVLVQGDSRCSFLWEDSDLRLISPRQHLLAMDRSCRELTLYDTQGAFLSRCSLPQSSHAVTGSDFIWSGYWEGYFFMDFIGSSSRLMFWDVNSDSEGEDLQQTSPGAALNTESVLEPQLYERAQALSDRFGVEILLAEQCSCDYTHFDTYELKDPQTIRSALDILERALSQYPDGFFSQLRYGAIDRISFELVGSLTVMEGVETHPESAAGFAQNSGSRYLVALDGFLIMEETVYHEISHIIDARLTWDALIRENALFNDEAWLALQPEGFCYAMSYTDLPEELGRYSESGFFIEDYSMTFPTEDRAVLMASAMKNHHWLFEKGSGKREKMRYYADCIRDCFDTTGWPKTTIWEQVLQ